MSRVARQTLWNSIWAYGGVALGYVNNILLFPNVLLDEEFGLVTLIVAAATLFGHFAGLGINSSLIKFFPEVKSENKKRAAFMGLVVTIPMVGFVLVSALTLVFSGSIDAYYSDKSSLFVDNKVWVYIMVFYFF